MLSRNDQSVIDTLLPSKGHPDLMRGIFQTEFDAFYRGFSRDATTPFRLSFRLALMAGAWFAPLLIRRAPPISRHDRATRERALEAMVSSRIYLIRHLAFVLKTVVSYCYGADRETRRVIGLTDANGV